MKDIFEFDELYNSSNVKSKWFERGDGRLETFGEDFENAKKIYKKHPKRVWTALDDSEGRLILVSGLRFVNRVYYLVTKEPCKSNDEMYLISE